MGRKLIFRALAGFMFIAFSIALPAMSVDFSQEPARLGSGQVRSIAFSPDGTILYAWHDAEGAVLLWDVEAQKQVGALKKDLGAIYSIAFSPDGKLLAFGCEDNTIRLWDVAGQNQVGMMQPPSRRAVHSVAFSPDGKTLASSGANYSGENVVRLWDVQTQQQVGELKGHTQEVVYSVAFSPDGRLLFSGGGRGDEAIRVWDVQTEKQVGELIGHLDDTHDLAFSPDRTILASAGGALDKVVYLWDFRAQKQVGVLGVHSWHVGSIAFSPNGKLLVSTGFFDDTVHLWDVKGQKRVGILKGHDASDMGWFDQVAFSPDGKWLACGSQNGVELWELNLPGPISRAYAHGPQPFDGTLYSDTWISLGWSAGDFAVSHDVYLGDNFDDVNDGVAETFQGNQVATNLVVGFPGFAYPDGLVPGTTYYWRIDEVNDTEPNSPWQGPVWSFTIPTTKAPVTKAHEPKPSDGVECVELNVELSWTAGDGARLHIVYFGENYDDVNNATGGLNQEATTYTPGPLELAKTYCWRVDELTGGRGGETHKGEVWSFTTQGAAGSPDPSNGATSVEMNATLSWEPADHAASRQVYFGTDKEVVRNANTGSPEYKGPKTLGDESYDPAILSWDTTYYWRVDEVNSVHPDSPWPGSVWSFTTADFLIIDDFEDYDIGNNEIWWAWIDGLGYATHPTEPPYPGNGTGSMVGDETAGSYMEETIVHGGGKSMPVFYDNNQQGKSKYSEVELTLNTMRDWTEQGVTQLGLWFHGNVANAQEQMYVKLNGSKVVYDGDLVEIIRPQWKQWSIDLTSFGVNLQNVTSFIMGFGNDTNPTPGGSGTMYFDDIRLYRTATEIVVPSEEIWFEAEAANTMTAPMTIWSDRADASGGQYIAVEPGIGSGAYPPADGHATYDFEVRGGVYKITGRVIASDIGDSFWFRIPGATTNTNNNISGWVKWNNIPHDDNWHWDDVHSNDDGDQTVHFTLAAGTHTLEIAYREDDTLLDAFIITNKLD